MKIAKVSGSSEILNSMLQKLGLITAEESKKEDWPEHLEEGRFTEYCKRNGFEGPCKECANKALESDDASVRGMASFYLNTVKP